MSVRIGSIPNQSSLTPFTPIDVRNLQTLAESSQRLSDAVKYCDEDGLRKEVIT